MFHRQKQHIYVWLQIFSTQILFLLQQQTQQLPIGVLTNLPVKQSDFVSPQHEEQQLAATSTLCVAATEGLKNAGGKMHFE